MHAWQFAIVFNFDKFLLLLFCTVGVHLDEVDDILNHSNNNNITDELIILLNTNGSNDDSTIINGSNITFGLC